MRPLFLTLLCCALSTFLYAQQNAATKKEAFGLSDLVKQLDSINQAQSGAATHELETLVRQLFGKKQLAEGKVIVKVEGQTVAWAIMNPKPTEVLRADGTHLGKLVRVGEGGLQVFATTLPNFTSLSYQIVCEGSPLAGGEVQVEHYEYTADSFSQPETPQGKIETFTWDRSTHYPDTRREVSVYIPAQYRKEEPACLMVWQDGTRHLQANGNMRVSVVMDNLIHQKKMPVTIGIFVDPGKTRKQREDAKAANRSFEYDSLGDLYARFLLNEIIPEAQKRYQLNLRAEPEGWAIAGGSSGGICAFTTAWERPDKFHKVLAWVGTFVDIRGGHHYPYLVRITERKPIRIYLLDGTNDLDNTYGNWPLANRMMEASLRYMNYDFRMDWTQCFHGSKGMGPALPEALRWLWRDVR